MSLPIRALRDVSAVGLRSVFQGRPNESPDRGIPISTHSAMQMTRNMWDQLFRSGRIDQSQKISVTASGTAAKKAFGRRS